jgi:hypothetical protein
MVTATKSILQGILVLWMLANLALALLAIGGGLGLLVFWGDWDAAVTAGHILYSQSSQMTFAVFAYSEIEEI